MSHNWIESLAYEMAEKWQENMETAYQAGFDEGKMQTCRNQTAAGILQSRWITTRNNHGRLETVFRGGLNEILEEIEGRET